MAVSPANTGSPHKQPEYGVLCTLLILVVDWHLALGAKLVPEAVRIFTY